VHPRLSSTTVSRTDPLDDLSEDDLRALVALGKAQAAETPAPPDPGPPASVH
jgi:hypothetical protein